MTFPTSTYPKVVIIFTPIKLETTEYNIVLPEGDVQRKSFFDAYHDYLLICEKKNLDSLFPEEFFSKVEVKIQNTTFLKLSKSSE